MGTPPPSLNTAIRYIPQGTSACYFITATANYQAPTRAEMQAGVNLTNEIASLTGFTVSSASVAAPDMSTRYVSNVVGQITSTDGVLSCYMDQHSNDVRSVMPQDTTGWVIFLWGGDVAGQLMDVWPIHVGANSPQPDLASAQLVEVQCTITSKPAINVTIPA